jgi:GT2 family glycosyltransferase
MLSIVVYGRNDQHGYNLHRRAALSLNALAEVLGSSDEIVFVDVGSPDSVATFPEGIDDLLTERARTALRIIRLRQGDLWRLGVAGAHIPEGLVRNIGARRARPENPWLLFSNTDVLLVEQKPGAFRAALGRLEPGLYHAPRCEIPTYLWEMFARNEPRRALEMLRNDGARLGLLQRIVAEDFAMFDNPGDFQLVSRETFAAVAGFDESMRLPFHVDVNFAVRVRLGGGSIRAFEAVACYHCEHSRTVTRMNNPNVASNDSDIYVRDVTHSAPPGQQHTWGAPSDLFEELRLAALEARLSAFLSTQRSQADSVREGRYRADAFNSLDYDPETVSHFVADRLCALPHGTAVGWFGADVRLIDATLMRLEGLGRRVRVLAGLPISGATSAEQAPIDRILSDATTLIFAFGASGLSRFRDFDNPPASFEATEAELAQLDIAGALRAIAAYAEPRPLIVVNAVNTEFERMTRQLVNGALAPFSTRLRDGWLRPTTLPFGLRLPDMTLAPGVTRRDDGVFAPAGLRGEIIVGGPTFDLPAGRFHLTADVRLTERIGRMALERVRLDLMAWGNVIASSTTLLTQTDSQSVLEFAITPKFLALRGVAPLEARLSSNGRADLLVRRVQIGPLGPPTLNLAELARAHRAG